MRKMVEEANEEYQFVVVFVVVFVVAFVVVFVVAFVVVFVVAFEGKDARVWDATALICA